MTYVKFCRRAGRFASDRSGAGAIEFAFLAPLLILMAMLTIDLGLGGYRQMQVQNAAQAGATYALYNYSYNTYSNQNIMTAVTSATSSSGISASPSPAQYCGCPGDDGLTTATCGTTCSNGQAAGTYVSVYATTTYHTLVSYPGVPDSFVFNAQATVRVQ